MNDMSKRLGALRGRVVNACQASGRDPSDVSILAVSKTQAEPAIAAALLAGHQHFGENYLQEALPKVAAHPGAHWHFIGAIQSNKTREIADNFDWVHSIASTKVARRLSDQRSEKRSPLNVLIQVNVSGEVTKAGASPDVAMTLASEIADLPNLNLQGLMTIPEASSDFAKQRIPFRKLRELRDNIAEGLNVRLPHLSMGMTGDFEAAIVEGATWIRIGTAIFGPREKSGDIT